MMHLEMYIRLSIYIYIYNMYIYIYVCVCVCVRVYVCVCIFINNIYGENVCVCVCARTRNFKVFEQACKLGFIKSINRTDTKFFSTNSCFFF